MTDMVSGIRLKVIGQSGLRLESLGFLVGVLLQGELFSYFFFIALYRSRANLSCA